MYLWYITVGTVLLVFLIDFIHYLMTHKKGHKRGCMFGFTRENELLYIPGDTLDEDEFDD